MERAEELPALQGRVLVGMRKSARCALYSYAPGGDTGWAGEGGGGAGAWSRRALGSLLSVLALILGDGATGRPVVCGCAEQGLSGLRAQTGEGVGGSGHFGHAPGKRAIPRHGQIWAMCEGGLGFLCFLGESPLWPEPIMSRRGGQRVRDWLEVPVPVQGGAHALASCCQSHSRSSVGSGGQGLCPGGIWSVKWGAGG